MLFGSSQAGPALVWREEVSKAGLVPGGREGCSKGWQWGLHQCLHLERTDAAPRAQLCALCRPPGVSKHKN